MDAESAPEARIYRRLPPDYTAGQPTNPPGSIAETIERQIRAARPRGLRATARQRPAAGRAVAPAVLTDNPAQAYRDKVQGKVLSVGHAPSSAELKTERHRERRARQTSLKDGSAVPRKPMSSRESKRRGLLAIPRAALRYELFRPLHDLWCAYMADLLGAPGQAAPDAALAKLLRADLHGSVLTVVRSTCPAYIGVGGICIRESERQFHLIQPSNRRCVVPKAHNVFALRVGDRCFTIYGDQFQARPFDRIAKKFKARATVDLRGT